MERALGNTHPKEVDRSLEVFLSIYRRRLLETTRPYPGVRVALDELRCDRILAVLTNKPRRESIALLEGLELASYFRFIFGGESFPNRKPHPIGVQTLIDRCGVERERTLMVGDSQVDFETAKNALIPVCLVSYGLGASEIEALGPDYIVNDLRQLATIVGSPR
jgi:phosphoglycolate phosphatase